MIEKECIWIDGKYLDEHHVYHIYETETKELFCPSFDTVEEAYECLEFWADYYKVPKTYYRIVEEIFLVDRDFRDVPYDCYVFPKLYLEG